MHHLGNAQSRFESEALGGERRGLIPVLPRILRRTLQVVAEEFTRERLPSHAQPSQALALPINLPEFLLKAKEFIKAVIREERAESEAAGRALKGKKAGFVKDE